MNERHWVERPDLARLGATVADHIAGVLGAAVAARGQGSLVVPGGRTPSTILQALATRALPWERLSVLPGDERIVDSAHLASNFGLLRRTLGTTGARLVPLLDTAALDDTDALARAAEVRLSTIPRPFDLVWLGMGTDGHIASLFPGQPLQAREPASVLAAHPDPLPPEAPYARLTLSLPALLDCRALMLVVNGAEKRKILETALAQGAGSPYPVGQLLAAATAPVTLFWSEAI